MSALLLALLAAAAPVHASASYCRDLRGPARGMRLDFPRSTKSQINCGMGDYSPSNYVRATDPDAELELHIVGVYEGTFLPGEARTREKPGLRSVRVVLYRTRKPVVLALSSFDPVLWDVTLTAEARLDHVILQGFKPSEVRGLPKDIPVIRRDYEQACAYAYGWERRHNRRGGDFALMVQGLRCATGLWETSFQGCHSGAVFEVPHYGENPVVSVGDLLVSPCPLDDFPETAKVRKGSRRGKKAEAARKGRRGRSTARKELNLPGLARKPASPGMEGWTRPTGEPESLPPPRGAPPKGGIPVRALAILLEGNRSLLSHDAVPDLVEALEKGDTYLRWRAADELGKLRPPAVRAVKPLIRALKDPENKVRSSAALALGNIGEEAEAAVKQLGRMLRDENADVRYGAERALERIGTKKALKTLKKKRRGR